MKRYLLDTNSAAHCIFRRKNVHERVKQARRTGAKIGGIAQGRGNDRGHRSANRRNRLDPGPMHRGEH